MKKLFGMIVLVCMAGLMFVGCNDRQTLTQACKAKKERVVYSNKKIKSLDLTIEKTNLNYKDKTRVTLKLTDHNNTTKIVEDNSIKYYSIPNGAIDVNNSILQVLNDGNISLRASYDGVSSKPITLNVSWIVDGKPVPPKPDPKINNATLLGIDTNKNGVRDDVERWIYKTFDEFVPCVEHIVKKEKKNGTFYYHEYECEDKPTKYNPIVREIYMQHARGAQYVLKHPDALNAKKAMAIEHDSKSYKKLWPLMAAQLCSNYFESMADKFGHSTLKGNFDFNIEETQKLYFNTSKRARMYFLHNQSLSGGVYGFSYTYEEEKEFCDFNVEQYLVKKQ